MVATAPGPAAPIHDQADEAAEEMAPPGGGVGAAEDISALLFSDQSDGEEMMGAISEDGPDEDRLSDEELGGISRSDEADPCTEADDSGEDTPSRAPLARTRERRERNPRLSASPPTPPLSKISLATFYKAYIM